MTPCRVCGGPASEKRRRQHRGHICDDCCRAHRLTEGDVEKRRARQRRFNVTDKGRSRWRRRIRLVNRSLGYAATPEEAKRINRDISARLAAFLAKQREDRRAAFA